MQNLKNRMANTKPVQTFRALANTKPVQTFRALANTKPGRYTRAILGEAWEGTKEQLKQAPADALKMGANVLSATTFGAAGVVSGMLDGNLGTATKNAAAAATAGVALSKGVTNRIESSVNKDKMDALKTKIEKQAYGKDYNQIMKDRADEEFKKDKEIRKLYKQQLGLTNKADLDKVLENAVEYRKYGINDNNIIMKTMKAERGSPLDFPDKRRIAAAKLAENSKTEKDFQTNMSRFAKANGVQQHHVDDMEKLVRSINNL